MDDETRTVRPALAAWVGLASLAAAMGIGRFAFTPLLPQMQEHFGTTLTQGAWLATANYLGYLAGAIASFAFAPRPGGAAKSGLVLVAVTTAAMGLTVSFEAWFVLRLLSGVASAYVLVGASAWALAHLAEARRADLAGWVFAGVGIGIAIAGVVTLLAAVRGIGPAGTWIALGVAAAAVTVAGWKPFSLAVTATASAAEPDARPLDRYAWTLVACYGGFGFGYIIPATFIPATARSLIADPAVFGWVWPLFGAAAAASTVAVSRMFATTESRRLAAAGLAVMAVGVLAPALQTTLASLVVSAAFVGGTFMVVTMAVMQEARRIGSRSAARLMAALTAAFAIGQLLGPVVVGLAASSSGGSLAVPNAIASLVLFASAAALGASRSRGKTHAEHPSTRERSHRVERP